MTAAYKVNAVKELHKHVLISIARKNNGNKWCMRIRIYF